MISYTIQHVLVMRLIMQYPLKSPSTLHHLLYLVSAEKAERCELAFYDFVRLEFGPYSPMLQTIIDELMVNQLLSRKDMELTPKGREIYYNLASSLRGFDDLISRCTGIMSRHKGDVKLLSKTVKTDFQLRKAAVGSRIFPSVE